MTGQIFSQVGDLVFITDAQVEVDSLQLVIVAVSLFTFHSVLNHDASQVVPVPHSGTEIQSHFEVFEGSSRQRLKGVPAGLCFNSTTDGKSEKEGVGILGRCGLLCHHLILITHLSNLYLIIIIILLTLLLIKKP